MRQGRLAGDFCQSPGLTEISVPDGVFVREELTILCSQYAKHFGGHHTGQFC